MKHTLDDPVINYFLSVADKVYKWWETKTSSDITSILIRLGEIVFIIVIVLGLYLRKQEIDNTIAASEKKYMTTKMFRKSCESIIANVTREKEEAKRKQEVERKAEKERERERIIIEKRYAFLKKKYNYKNRRVSFWGWCYPADSCMDATSDAIPTIICHSKWYGSIITKTKSGILEIGNEITPDKYEQKCSNVIEDIHKEELKKQEVAVIERKECQQKKKIIKELRSRLWKLEQERKQLSGWVGLKLNQLEITTTEAQISDLEKQ